MVRFFSTSFMVFIFGGDPVASFVINSKFCVRAKLQHLATKTHSTATFAYDEKSIPQEYEGLQRKTEGSFKTRDENSNDELSQASLFNLGGHGGLSKSCDEWDTLAQMKYEPAIDSGIIESQQFGDNSNFEEGEVVLGKFNDPVHNKDSFEREKAKVELHGIDLEPIDRQEGNTPDRGSGAELKKTETNPKPEKQTKGGQSFVPSPLSGSYLGAVAKTWSTKYSYLQSLRNAPDRDELRLQNDVLSRSSVAINTGSDGENRPSEPLPFPPVEEAKEEAKKSIPYFDSLSKLFGGPPRQYRMEDRRDERGSLSPTIMETAYLDPWYEEETNELDLDFSSPFETEANIEGRKNIPFFESLSRMFAGPPRRIESSSQSKSHVIGRPKEETAKYVFPREEPSSKHLKAEMMQAFLSNEAQIARTAIDNEEQKAEKAHRRAIDIEAAIKAYAESGEMLST